MRVVNEQLVRFSDVKLALHDLEGAEAPSTWRTAD